MLSSAFGACRQAGPAETAGRRQNGRILLLPWGGRGLLGLCLWATWRRPVVAAAPQDLFRGAFLRGSLPLPGPSGFWLWWQRRLRTCFGERSSVARSTDTRHFRNRSPPPLRRRRLAYSLGPWPSVLRKERARTAQTGDDESGWARRSGCVCSGRCGGLWIMRGWSARRGRSRHLDRGCLGERPWIRSLQ